MLKPTRRECIHAFRPPSPRTRRGDYQSPAVSPHPVGALCPAQRIKIIMIAGGNHTIISYQPPDWEAGLRRAIDNRPYGVRGDGGRLIIAPTGCGETAGGMHECIPYEGRRADTFL